MLNQSSPVILVRSARIGALRRSRLARLQWRPWREGVPRHGRPQGFPCKVTMNPRPFRFGVLGESVRSAADLLDTARRAESARYSTFLMRDHFIEEPFGHQLAPLAALATAAAATKTLRVGSLVICNDYRHPAVVAKEAATLGLLSGGRFELGLGAGFSQP